MTTKSYSQNIGDRTFAVRIENRPFVGSCHTLREYERGNECAAVRVYGNAKSARRAFLRSVKQAMAEA